MKKLVNFLNNKKGVSPVIATVLLIGIVLIIAMIVFVWFRGLTQEAVTKFDKNVELVCEEVQFDASYTGGTLSISNVGNVPIFEMKLKISGGKSFETKSIKDVSPSWSNSGLDTGRVFSDSVSISGDSVTLIPVLVGNSESGQKTYVCNDRFGKKINV